MTHRGFSRNLFYILLGLTTVGLLSVGHSTQAATVRTAAFQVGVGGQTHPIFGGVFKGGASLDVGDVNGDGQDEIVVGAGEGGGPQIEIYTPAGTRIGAFFAFPTTLRSGISLAVGDLDADGTDEIIAGPRGNYKPEVRVFSISGQLKASFLAFESSYTGGLDLAALEKRGDDGGLILVASGSGRDQEVRGFTMRGVPRFDGWFPQTRHPNNGMSIAADWSTTYAEPVLVSGAGAGEPPLVTVHGLYSGKLLASWRPYSLGVTTGVDVDFRNEMVITSPGRRGGPQIRTFTVGGQKQSEYLAFEPTFTGGLEVAWLETEAGLVGVVTPSGKQTGVDTPVAGKTIVIDLSDQKLQMFENGRLVSTHTVSTGKWSTPTPTGTFFTRSKITVAYSRPYDLYMEYWMAFTPDGAYGLHALPYWRTAGGGKYYEGTAHLGTPVSHGCIRQSVAEAKALYNWAPVGTSVTIRK